MSIRSHISEDGRSLTIRISGRFDFSQHQEFSNAAEQANGSVQRFVVDLDQTEYIDSSALGMLLVLRDKVNGVKDNIKLINANPQVKNILTIANFNQLFAIV